MEAVRNFSRSAYRTNFSLKISIWNTIICIGLLALISQNESVDAFSTFSKSLVTSSLLPSQLRSSNNSTESNLTPPTENGIHRRIKRSINNSWNVARLNSFKKRIFGSSIFPFRSSRQNAEIAFSTYPNSPLNRFVALALGDELPVLRDELAARTRAGQDPITRHLIAWTRLTNWIPDFNNNAKELADPY